MNTKPCSYEEAVTAAVRSGNWSPELKAHRDGCLVCAELTLVVAALASLAIACRFTVVTALAVFRILRIFNRLMMPFHDPPPPVAHQPATIFLHLSSLNSMTRLVDYTSGQPSLHYMFCFISLLLCHMRACCRRTT